VYHQWRVSVGGHIIGWGCNGKGVSCVSVGGGVCFRAVLYLPPVCVLSGDWCWGHCCAYLVDGEVPCIAADVVAAVLNLGENGL